MARPALVAVLCVGIVGCQVSTAPTPVSRFDDTHGVSMMTAPWDGRYTLYATDREGRRTVIQSAHLRKDDPLGFRQRRAGPVAVAGDAEAPLMSGRYEWVMEADRGQVNWVGTTVLVVVVAAAAVVVLYAVAAQQAVDHIFSRSR